jgi:hypothetical protein
MRAWMGYLKEGGVSPPLTEAPQGQAWLLSDVLSRPFSRSNSELLARLYDSSLFRVY